ncbi:MAG: Nif11 family protein [Coriobacteriia bacterium]|nr:Nif11 family protein [Coriobacteriia bacterium]
MEAKDLTPEQLEKLKTCKSPEDVLALAKEEGYELTDAQLEAVSGGESWDDDSLCYWMVL